MQPMFGLQSQGFFLSCVACMPTGFTGREPSEKNPQEVLHLDLQTPNKTWKDRRDVDLRYLYMICWRVEFIHQWPITHNYRRKKHLIRLFYMKKKQSRSLKQISFGVIPKEPHFCCNPIGSFLSYVVRMDHLEVPPFIQINLMNGDSLLQKNCWRMSLTQSSRLRASMSKLNELFLCPLINSKTKTPKLNTSAAFDKYPCIIYSGAIYPLLPRNKANMEIRPRSQFSFFGKKLDHSN